MSASVAAAVGPVVRAVGMAGATVGEVVRVGPARLLGEIIALDGRVATIQVYEETAGLQVGDVVEQTGAPLRARLGPGLLGATLDGLQRPLDRLAGAGTWLLLPGIAGPSAVAAGSGPGTARGAGGDEHGETRDRWAFEPSGRPGDAVGPGDVLGTVREGPIVHRILVPPDTPRGVLRALERGTYDLDEPVGELVVGAGGGNAAGPDGVANDGAAGRLATDAADRAAGVPVPLRLGHDWPVRRPRPVRRRLPTERPLTTGQRVFDMLFPLAEGGTAVIPGGFGTGKTVVEQSLARWADADIVVYIGCGERGNEMAELLASFPQLVDPRTGEPLIARTVLIANTSNMPVAAREASVQLGITIAEYFRDQGRRVALLADSTSRWAEALREISGRLEELPGEEGFPAYLASRLAAFYERAGRVETLGQEGRTGSVTLVGAVSPPGGDFSEPVTQASLRLAGTFWALDAQLAHARHFPAIGWTQSYSLYVDSIAPWYAEHVSGGWVERRAAAIELLVRERQLLEIVQLVGADALPDEDRVTLEVARLLRETFLQQHAFDPVDAARPLDVQYALLGAVLAVRRGLLGALAGGATLEQALEAPVLDELRRARQLAGDGLTGRLDDLAARLESLGAPAAEAVG